MFRIFLFAILLTLSSNLLPAQEKKNFTAEEKTIMEVIEMESRYFWARDLKNWKKLYVHEPYVVWTSSSQDGVRRYEGWKTWLNQVKTLFDQSPDPIPYEGDVEKYDYLFRIYSNGAWVSFKQKNLGTTTFETRILEKVNGKWKIAMVQLIFDVNPDVTAQEDDSEGN